jgi:hypothetical protein
MTDTLKPITNNLSHLVHLPNNAWSDSYDLGFLRGCLQVVQMLHALANMPNSDLIEIAPETRSAFEASIVLLRHDLERVVFPELPEALEFTHGEDLFRFLKSWPCPLCHGETQARFAGGATWLACTVCDARGPSVGLGDAELARVAWELERKGKHVPGSALHIAPSAEGEA